VQDHSTSSDAYEEPWFVQRIRSTACSAQMDGWEMHLSCGMEATRRWVVWALERRVRDETWERRIAFLGLAADAGTARRRGTSPRRGGSFIVGGVRGLCADLREAFELGLGNLFRVRLGVCLRSSISCRGEKARNLRDRKGLVEPVLVTLQEMRVRAVGQ